MPLHVMTVLLEWEAVGQVKKVLFRYNDWEDDECMSLKRVQQFIAGKFPPLRPQAIILSYDMQLEVGSDTHKRGSMGGDMHQRTSIEDDDDLRLAFCQFHETKVDSSGVPKGRLFLATDPCAPQVLSTTDQAGGQNPSHHVTDGMMSPLLEDTKFHMLMLMQALERHTSSVGGFSHKMEALTRDIPGQRSSIRLSLNESAVSGGGSDLAGQLEEQREQIELLIDQRDRLSTQLESLLTSPRGSVQSQAAALESVTKQRDHLLVKVKQLQQEAGHGNGDLTSRSSDDIWFQASEAAEAVHEAEIQRDEAIRALEESTHQRDELSRQLESLSSGNAMAAALSDLTAQRDALQSELEANLAMSPLPTVREEPEVMREELEEAKRDKEAAVEKVRTEMQTQLDGCLAQVQKYHRNSVHQLNEKNSALEAAAAGHKFKIQMQKKKLRQEAEEALTVQRREHERLMVELADQLGEKESEINKLVSRLSLEQDTHHKQLQQLKSVQFEASAAATTATSSAATAELSSALEASKQEVVQLQKEQDISQKLLKQKYLEIEELQTVAKQQQQQSDQQEEAKGAEAGTEALHSQVDSLQTQLEHTKEALAKAVRENKHYPILAAEIKRLRMQQNGGDAKNGHSDSNHTPPHSPPLKHSPGKMNMENLE